MSLSVEEILKATKVGSFKEREGVFFEGVFDGFRTSGRKNFSCPERRPLRWAMPMLGGSRQKGRGCPIEEPRVDDFRWNGYRSQTVIAVKDSLRALGDLARARRRKICEPIVAILEAMGKQRPRRWLPGVSGLACPFSRRKETLNN